MPRVIDNRVKRFIKDKVKMLLPKRSLFYVGEVVNRLVPGSEIIESTYAQVKKLVDT